MTCKHCGISESTLRWQARKIEELEAQIENILGAPAPVEGNDTAVTSRLHFKLSAAEGRIFAVLLQREFVPRALLEDCVGRTRRGRASEDRYNIVCVLMSRMRKKLAPIGITIDNIPGAGYRLGGRERAAEILNLAA